MKKNSNKVFWTLQIIGWGIPAIFNAWGTLIASSQLTMAYALFESSVLFLTGIFGTWILRLKLKESIDFKSLSKANFFHLSKWFFGITHLIIIMLLVSIEIYRYIIGLSVSVTPLNIFSTWISIHIFVFIWTALYIAIKTVMQLRQARIEHLVLLAELKESQLNTLKGQINPHFMFNNLNNIRGLMLEDVYKARDMITRLSEMLRYGLNKDKVDKIILSEEIAMIDNYIALSKIQFEKRLIYRCEIDKAVLTCTVPPMMIQMLIENAVKHGIANQTTGGLVQLNIYKNNNELISQVINSGHLLDESNSTQLGIKNIKKRLDLLYHGKANFTLVEDDDSVIATIKIPLS
jgi:LytS/YehU family sensor histidine kinase